jgi:tryptophan 2,3-dioxygenase
MFSLSRSRTPNSQKCMPKAKTYGNYLRLDELLALQKPRDEVEHDEMLFIVIHQVYELWFKVLLHEIDYCCALLTKTDTPRASHTLNRVLTILKVLVKQLDILETMNPSEFLTFRERLDSASGFQSDQFRALEAVLGRKTRASVERFAEGTRAREALERRWSAPTLWDHFIRYLANEGHAVPEQQLARDMTQPVGPSEEMQQVLVELYRSDPKNTALCERLVDLDEGLQEWRYRHVKMVERTIGTKSGTGGSAGSKYLLSTLNSAVFPDLWEIRSQL